MFLDDFMARVNPIALKKVEDRLYLTMREHKADSQQVLESGLFYENCLDQYSPEALGLMTIYTFHDENETDEFVYLGQFTCAKEFNVETGEINYNVSCPVDTQHFHKSSTFPEDLPSIKREAFEYLFKKYIIGEFNELVVGMIHEIEKEEEKSSSTEREDSVSSILMSR